MTDDEHLISVDELAGVLGVPVRWIYEKTRFNEIPHYRVGRYCRFRPSEIWEWLESSRPNIEGGTNGQGIH